MSAQHLISTVGTSLLGNLRRGQFPPDTDVLQSAFTRGEWENVGQRLRDLSGNLPFCGAEINTIHALLDKGFAAEKADLYFCLSESKDGEAMGKILCAYFEPGGHRVSLNTIAGLRDDDVEKFRREGLVNLVRHVGRIARTQAGGDPRHVILNATGGYKAQIALAVLMGQALGITVYYKHERFDSIMAMPPMPITLDYELLGDYADWMDEFREGGTVDLKPGEDPDPRLLPLLEIIEEAGSRCAELSAVGQVFLEGYDLRYPPAQTLPPPAHPDQRTGNFRDDHYPKEFGEYINKVYNETSYLTRFYSLAYNGQRGIRDRRFRPGDEVNQVIAEYQDKNKFGARAALYTTGTTKAQQAAVINDLTRRYGRG